ncbi:MAG TPA: TatD family hydrolase [Thermoanaerobaculia bacterium]|jgi:TatD DNase family protein|nr:TatD family hydrolase [Thermoanaerobaculia bacterium]
MLIDSHCHLQSLKGDDEAERALDAARERGVSGFLVPAIRLDQAEEILALCHRHPDVWCALGVHPHDAASWVEGDEDRLRGLLFDPKAVAVGECGLDFYYDHAPREVQDRVMRAQWRIACELDLPVVVHNRDSNEAMLEVVRDPEFATLRADFHSYAGGLEMARELIDHGFSLGLSGMITFPKADNVREVIPILPPDRALVETDTPYLAPIPYRGKPNRPAYVVEIAERLAKETGETLEQVTRRTGENFFRLFGKAAG